MESKSQNVSSAFSVTVRQVQPQVYKFTLKGIFSLAGFQTLREKVLLLTAEAGSERVYILFDFHEFKSVKIEVKKWVNKNKLIRTPTLIMMIFGLNNTTKSTIQYILQKASPLEIHEVNNEHAALLLVNNLIQKQQKKDIPVGPTAITGMIKSKIQIGEKSLDLIHHKQWSYKNQNESYFYEIDLIDNNIFVSRPSGYIEYDHSLTANALFDKVLQKMHGPKDTYYRIQDYSNVIKTSLSARRDFTQYIANCIDRIDLLVFYGLNTYMKAVVKFGKLFHPKFHKVKVVNTFDDALRLIATHKYGKSFFDKEPVQQKDIQIELSAEEEVIILRDEMKKIKALQQKKLDKLFQYISNIMWDESNESILKEAEEDTAFSDVFGAVNMLKTDIAELSLERENTIRNLQGQLKKYIKELRKAKADLQRVLVDKDDFIQALNHELRTPLQSINSTIELLKLAEDKQEESRLIDLINKSSKLLNKKITQIKSVSDLNLGKRELSSSIFSISKLIQSQVDMHESVIQAKQLTLRFIHDESIPSYLMGDIDKINQVLDHFIDNAIKYTNEGVITIRTKLIENLETQLVLRIEVEDTGIGVIQSVQEHLFDDTSLVKSDIGRNSHIGLGLFICKQLVEMMGGDIGYRSTEKEGSCFYFVLTLNRGSFFKELNLLSRAKSLKGLSSIFTEKKEILFLEEDESKRDIIQMMFEKLGVNITFANNEEHLTSLSTKGIFGMVFLDSIAPMNVCTNILNKIRESEIIKDTEKRIPIIAITANPVESYKEECLNGGFDEILIKPYTLSDLKKVLVKYLD